MKKLTVLLITLVNLAAIDICAQGAVTPLSYHQFTSEDEAAQILQSHAIQGYAYRENSIGSWQLPDNTTINAVYSIPLTDPLKPVQFIVGSAKSTSSMLDRLWIDWNGDRKITADEAYIAEPSMDKNKQIHYVFGPCNHKSDKGNISLYATLSAAGNLEITPTGMRVGTVTFGKRKLKVGVIDNNLNGIYGERVIIDHDSDAENGDLIAIDFNGNGKFDGELSSGIPQAYGKSELLPMTNIVQIPGEGFFRIAVHPDGSAITSEPLDGTVGKLIVAAKSAALVLAGRRGILHAQVQNGELLLPTDDYTVESVIVTKPDSKGKLWTVTVTPEKNKTLNITEGHTQRLPFAASFTLNLSHSHNRLSESFGVSLVDSAGGAVDGPYSVKGERVPPASLRILRDGKQVYTAKFAYG